MAAAFAAVYIIWGSTYLAIRFVIESLPPFLWLERGLLSLVLLCIFWLGYAARQVIQRMIGVGLLLLVV
jgi:hypothetical protein